MAVEQVLAIQFGMEGDDETYLGAGWSGAEPGQRWMVGSESEVWLNHPGPGTEYTLQLDVSPYLSPPALPSQRLTVVMRGQVVGRSVVTNRSNLSYRIPAELLAAPGPVRIVLQHIDAARPTDHGHPNDSRALSCSMRQVRLLRVIGDMSELRLEGGAGITPIELEALVGMPAEQFLLQFESLGDNCEFGLVQRRCGAEPLSLLRFSNIMLNQLIHGIETGFEGLGDVDDLECWLGDRPRREYVLRAKRYGLVFHTFLYEGEVDQGTLVQQQAQRLKFLRRKLLEDLGNAEKIFVVKRNDPLRQEEVLGLFSALNAHGRNRLLWVVPAEEGNEPGTVEQTMPGLLKGYVDRLAPSENAHDLSLEVWLQVCANAYALTRSKSA